MTMTRALFIAACVFALARAIPAIDEEARDSALNFQISGADVIAAATDDDATASDMDEMYTSRYIDPPPVNNNWDQRDFSSMFQLGYGAMLDSKALTTGATFRSFNGMGNLDGSCQYWQNGLLNFADPGWNPYLAGVGSYYFDESRACGQCLLLTNPDTKYSVVVMVTDYCPPPCSSRQLDLQVSASAFLASGDSTNSRAYKGGPENFSNLQVRKVECDWKGEPLLYWFGRGSSTYHWYLIIAFHTVPVTAMSVERLDLKNTSRVVAVGKVTGHDKFGRWVVEFRGDGGAGLYRVKLSGQGQEDRPIEDIIYWNGQAGVRVRGNKNFPLTHTATNIPHWPLP